MTKTIDISLAGMLFHLEESAYIKLKKYLRAVKTSINHTEDVEEVMNEIEARIAELLLEKQQNPQQVINEKAIDDIIAIMGQPEDFEEDIEPDIHTTPKVKKALFRDMDHSMIGGVAAGLAQYIGIDITLMRLIFVLLLFITHGSFILVYLLLWIIIPKAKTAADKLRMKGNNANLDNIVDQVTAEETSKKKVKLGETIENTGSEIVNVLVKIIGVLIVFTTGLLLIGLLISVLTISPLSDVHMIINDTMLQAFNIPLGFISILSFIILGIPVILLFLLGFKILFPNSNALHKNILIVAGTIWFLSLVYVVTKSISVLSHKNTTATVIAIKKDLNSPKDTLFIKAREVHNTQTDWMASSHISYRFLPSNDGLIHFKIVKKAEGINHKGAQKNAENIIFEWQQDSLSNSLSFDDMILYPSKNMISMHKVIVYIEIPENLPVKLDPGISQLTNIDDCDEPLTIINKNGQIICLEELNGHHDQTLMKMHTKNAQIKIDDNGIHIKSKDSIDKAEIKIDENGIEIRSDNEHDKASVTIDENGININN